MVHNKGKTVFNLIKSRAMCKLVVHIVSVYVLVLVCASVEMVGRGLCLVSITDTLTDFMLTTSLYLCLYVQRSIKRKFNALIYNP